MTKQIETVTATIIVEIDVNAKRALNARHTVICPKMIVGEPIYHDEAKINHFESKPCKTLEEGIEQLETLTRKCVWSLESSYKLEDIGDSIRKSMWDTMDKILADFEETAKMCAEVEKELENEKKTN